MAESEDQSTPILSRLRPPVGAVRNKKRKGRGLGSGLGKTAGRGQKGQKARRGGDIGKVGFEGGQMPMQRRMPKFGFKNPSRKVIVTVNLRDLARFDAGATVDEAALRDAKLIKGSHDGVKILGSGELKKALTVRADAFSASAKEKIEKAGGKAEVLEG
jgi:large subunit ribosomal protein L15